MTPLSDEDIAILAGQLSAIEPSEAATRKAVEGVRDVLTADQDDAIASSLRPLAALTPSEEGIGRALDRTRQRLEQSHRKGRRSLWLKVFGPIALAAGIALAALLVVLYTPQAAALTPLERLEQIGENVGNYNGWIRIEWVNETPVRDLGSQGKVVTLKTWYHPVRQEWIRYDDMEFIINAFWMANRRSTYYHYDKRTNVLTISPDGNFYGKLQVGPLTPMETGATAMIDQLKAQSAENEIQITTETMNGQERFDLAFSGTSKKATHVEQLTVWADSKTKLIHRSTSRSPRGFVASHYFAYDEAPPTGVTELGVPIDAKVIDNRHDPETTALLDRLRSRIAWNENLGDYTAVYARSIKKKSGELKPFRVDIYTRFQKQWVHLEYRGLPSTLLPPKWPTPSLDETLSYVKEGYLQSFFVMQNGTCWYGRRRKEKQPFAFAGPIYLKHRQVRWFPRNCVSAHIWSHWLTYILDSRGYSVKFERLQDPKRPGLVGLKFTRIGLSPRESIGKHVRTVWMDPERDDVPVERDLPSYTPDGRLTDVSKVTYHKYAQRPEGQWYPTDWTVELVWYPKDKPSVTTVYPCRLQFFPYRELDLKKLGVPDLEHLPSEESAE